MANNTTARFDWHEYINESPYESFRNSSQYVVYMQLVESWQKAWAFSFGDLRYKNVPKKVIQERTQPIAISKGHPPYCFRFQCLTTGRKSKFIKECEYHLFGITKRDAVSGTGYGPQEDIADKLKPVRDDLFNRMNRLRAQAFPTTGGVWWSRYSEYLKSDDWLNVREAVLQRDGNQCRLTGEAFPLQVHHLSYKNVGRERLEDLITLHQSVHEAIHDKENARHLHYSRRLDEALSVSQLTR